MISLEGRTLSACPWCGQEVPDRILHVPGQAAPGGEPWCRWVALRPDGSPYYKHQRRLEARS